MRLVTAGVALAWVTLALGLATPAGSQQVPSSDPFRFAMQLYHDGMYIPAAEEFLSLAAQSPNLDRAQDARVWAAECYAAAGQWARALEVLEPVVANPVEKSRACKALVLKGRCLERKGEPDAALEAYATLVGQYADCPQRAEAAVLAGLLSLDREQPKRSLAFFATVGDDGPDSLRVRARLGEARAAALLGDRARAEQVLARLEKLRGLERSCEARLEMGSVYALLERFQDAATAFGKAAVNCPDSLTRFDAWTSLARVAWQQGKPEQAGQAHESAGALVPGERRAVELEAAGEAYLRAKRWDDAIRVLSAARQAAGGLPLESLTTLAEAYRGAGQYSKAVDVLREIEDSGTGEGAVEARWEVGETYLEARWYRLAANAFERFWLMDPEDPRAPGALARVGEILARELHRPAGAAEVYQRLATDYPSSAQAPASLFSAGESWMAAGLPDRARDAWTSVLREYPTSAVADSAEGWVEAADLYHRVDWNAARPRLESAPSLEGEAKALLLGDVAFENLKDYTASVTHYSAAVKAGGGKNARALLLLGVSLRRMAEDPRGDLRSSERREALDRARTTLTGVVESFPGTEWAEKAAWERDRMETVAWKGEPDRRAILDIGRIEQFGKTYPERRGVPRSRILLELARDYEVLGKTGDLKQYAAAAGFYGGLAEAEPGRVPDPRVLEARCWFLAEQYEQAASRYRTLAEAYRGRPLDLELRTFEARSLLATGETEAAVRSFERIVRETGDSPWIAEAALELGNLRAQAGNPAAAAEAYARSAEVSTDPSVLDRADLGRATALGRLGRTQEALDVLDALMDRSRGLPQADRAAMVRAGILESAGDLEGAVAIYSDLIGVSPSADVEVAARARSGDAYLRLGRNPEAVSSYRAALAGPLPKDDRPAVLRNLAAGLYRADRGRAADSALVELRALGAADTTVARVALERGRYLLRSGNTKEGTAMFVQVMENFPAEDLGQRARYEIALQHLAAQEYKEARDLLQVVIDSHPGADLLSQAWFRLGSTYYLTEEFARAAESYQHVIDLDPSGRLAAEAWFNLGLSLEKQGDWLRAAETYGALLKRFPEYEERDRVAFKVGYALQEAGRTAEAIPAYEAVLPGAEPELGAEVQFWIGECYIREGDLDRALLAVLKIGYLYPGETQWAATGELRAAEIHTRAGRIADARALYRRVIEKYGAASQWGGIAREEMKALGPEK